MKEKFTNKLMPNEGMIIYDDWFQKRFDKDSKRTIRL